MKLPELPRKIEEPDFPTPPTSLEQAQVELDQWLQIRRVAAFRIGSILWHVQTKELFKPKFKSFEAWLDTQKGPSRATLFRYKSYAARISRRLASEQDPERIDYALALLPKRGKVTPISDKLLAHLKVEVVRRGTARTVKFADATTAELEKAASDAHELRRGKHDPEHVRQCEAVQRKLGAGPGALGDSKLVRRRGKSVTVIEIPAERLPEFLKMLK